MNDLNKEFQELVRPLMEWLSINYHPHAEIYITIDSAHVAEGSIGYVTDDFIKD